MLKKFRKKWWRIFIVLIVLIISLWLISIFIGINHEQKALASQPPGPFQVSSKPVTISNLDTTIHYPIKTTNKSYPLIIIVHGMMDTKTSHQFNARHLASYGFIVIIPSFGNRPLPNTLVWAENISDIIDYLTQYSNHEVFSKIDLNRIGLAGHSAGGIAALLAATKDQRIDTLIGLDAIAQAGDYEKINVTVPSLLLEAPKNPGQRINVDLFDYLKSANKMKLIINNSTHCDFMDQGFTASACGIIFKGYNESRWKLIKLYMTAWFSYYLNNNLDYYSILYGQGIQKSINSNLIQIKQ